MSALELYELNNQSFNVNDIIVAVVNNEIYEHAIVIKKFSDKRYLIQMFNDDGEITSSIREIKYKHIKFWQKDKIATKLNNNINEKN